MFKRTEKERVPFKKSRIIRVYECDGCKREMRLVQNWHGSTPPGGFICSTCGTVQTI